MSNHGNDSPELKALLEEHGLPTDTPSQLADAFRLGWEASRNRVVRVAYETMQFFEIELPRGENPKTYCDTKEAREHFASLMESGFIDFRLERMYDKDGNEVTDE